MKSSIVLSSLREDVVAFVQTTNSEFVPLDDLALNWKPSADRWSILECYEHLNRYSTYYNNAIKTTLQRAHTEQVADYEFNPTWLGSKFVAMMSPENKKQHKAFRYLNPANSLIDRSVLEKFIQFQDDLLTIIDAAAFVNLNDVKIPVEFIRLLKINLGDALKFVTVHTQRHLNQALKARTTFEISCAPALKV